MLQAGMAPVFGPKVPSSGACGEGSSMTLKISCAALIAAVLALLAGPASARCSKNLVEEFGPRLQRASFDDGLRLSDGASPNRALITFLGHASYQIDTPQGVR